MDVNNPVIRQFIQDSAKNKAETIHKASLLKVGVLEIWDFTKTAENRIVLSYEVDDSIPEGEIRTEIRR